MLVVSPGFTNGQGETVMGVSISVDKLSDAMEFDRVIQVHDDGTVTVGGTGLYAPECHIDSVLPHGEIDSATRPHVSKPWTLMNGYSGQYGYAGPVMHSSELIGGKLASDILATPGFYVAVVVTDLDADTDAGDDDVAGWAVAHRED